MTLASLKRGLNGAGTPQLSYLNPQLSTGARGMLRWPSSGLGAIEEIGILFWTFRLWSGHSDVRQKPAAEIQ